MPIALGSRGTTTFTTPNNAVRFGEKADEETRLDMKRLVYQYFPNDEPDERLMFTQDYTHLKNWTGEQGEEQASPLLHEMVHDIGAAVAEQGEQVHKKPFTNRVAYFLISLREGTKKDAVKGFEKLKRTLDEMWESPTPRKALVVKDMDAVLVRQMFRAGQ